MIPPAPSADSMRSEEREYREALARYAASDDRLEQDRLLERLDELWSDMTPEERDRVDEDVRRKAR